MGKWKLYKLRTHFYTKCSKNLNKKKKIWIIRSLQQRYQFLLKGTALIVKEWQLVAAIFENQKNLENEKRFIDLLQTHLKNLETVVRDPKIRNRKKKTKGIPPDYERMLNFGRVYPKYRTQ